MTDSVRISKFLSFQIAFFFILSGCCCKQEIYFSKQGFPFESNIYKSDYFLVLLVDARQLDYSCNKAFFRSLVKHPSDGSKNSDVGHAWIYLRGVIDGQPVELEGGHSGEQGIRRPKYFEGIMHYIDEGDSNPVRYLWESLEDGYFQEGCGGHVPTFAIKIDLTVEQFYTTLDFIERYDYQDYSLTCQQCCSFVQQVAHLVDLELECAVAMAIDPVVKVRGEFLPLWNDSCYSQIVFPCPEVLEGSMREAVREGRVEPALDWYLSNKHQSFSEHWNRVCEDIQKFPMRLGRMLQFYY